MDFEEIRKQIADQTQNAQREWNMEPVKPNEVGPMWQETLGEDEIKQVISCDFDFAEEVITIVQFTNGKFEVGIGESLRPYDQVYKGTDEKKAIETFIKVCIEHINI